MKDNMTMAKFGYDQFLRPFQMDGFMLDFFNDATVQSALRGKLGRVTKVSYSELAHDVTSLSFFDKLKPQIVRANGTIVKCLDEYFGSFVVSDLLRKSLLMDDEEIYNTFSESDRKEFIFHVFQSICLGGTCCQFEDELEPYLNATKNIYKDLITYFSLD